MKKETKYIIGVVIAIAVIIGGISLLDTSTNKSVKYDSFAMCLAEKGATFYGAFWCPHCQEQKKLFGKSAKKLPYIECSTANGQGMLPVCKDAGIESYPTWVFPDGSQVSGEQPLQTLSEKTSCILPQ